MVDKDLFEERVSVICSAEGSTRKFFSASEYNNLIGKIRLHDSGLPFSDKNDYRKTKRFVIEEVGDLTRLKHRDSGKILLRNEDFYEVLSRAHEETIHGGITVMLKHLRSQYFNVHQEVVTKYIQLCGTCELKKKKHHSKEVVRPILTENMNGRCQVDLIDYQSRPDGEYKFVLVYQDHMTKYVILRALKTKTMETIVDVLFPIFIDFGAPLIVHTDNGREFSNKLIEALLKIWPDCTLLHGKPRHSQSQGSVERANQDVEKKIACWMSDQKTTNWSRGLPFIQYAKNRCHHQGIGCTPFEAMFGIKCRNSLDKLGLPTETLQGLNTEEDLERLRGETDSSAPNEPHSSASSQHLDDSSSSNSSVLGDVVHSKLADFERIREKCRKRQVEQAERMLTRTEKKRREKVAVGSSVRVPVPLVDRAKSDHHNILAVVTEARDGHLYVLGTKFGTLEGLYTSNQFEVCKEKFVHKTDVPAGKVVTLREAAGLLSVGGNSQGFIKCSCKKVCGPRCKCASAGLVCNSRCHKNFTCNNLFN